MSESTAVPAEIVKVSDQAEMQVTPMAMLALAVKQKADIDKISKLMDLQERWEKREAEKAFVAALAAFKKNPPEIIKNKKVSYDTAKGKTEYKHSTLDRVTTSIGGALGEHGLSARWRTHQEGARIRVTCILQHEMGHAEETTLEASPDDSGSKNPVQAIASTVTYLERYTLLAATGMATRDDSDGITFGDAEDMVNDLRSAATLDELQSRFNKAYKRASAAKDKAAMAIAIETKDQRKRELENPAARKSREEFDAKWEKRGVNMAGRQMAIGKANGDLAAADKELESLATETPMTSSASENSAAPKAKGGTRRATKGPGPEEAKPPAPPPTEQKDMGF